MTEPRERRMLLDTTELYFLAFHAIPDSIQAPNGTPMTALRGLFDMIARLASESQPTEVAACWDDDWRPLWRVDPRSSLAASVRARVLAAADYLKPASAVVNVTRDLELPGFDARLQVTTREQTALPVRLSSDWGLGTSLEPARRALRAVEATS